MQTNGCGCSSVPLPRVLARTTLMVLLLMSLPLRPPTPATQTPGPGNTSPTTNHKQKLGAGVQLRKSFEEMLENGNPPLAGAGPWSERQHGDKCKVLACAGLYCTVLYCAGCISRQDVIKPDHRDTVTSHFPPLAAQ